MAEQPNNCCYLETHRPALNRSQIIHRLPLQNRSDVMLIEGPHVGLGSWLSWEMRNGQKCAVAWCQNLESEADEICDPDSFAYKKSK